MAIEIKSNIETPKPQSKTRWSALWDALDKCPVGSGIQETYESLGVEAQSIRGGLRARVMRKYGDAFSFSQAGGMITIIRLKDSK